MPRCRNFLYIILDHSQSPINTYRQQSLKVMYRGPSLRQFRCV